MERELKKDGSDAHWCDTCKSELATKAVTDAVEQQDGSWLESAPRRGCDRHPVFSMVHFRDGASCQFTEYEQYVEGKIQ